MARERENVVDQLSELILLRILRGEIAPGSHLPSVRALAVEYDVNVSTVQRVLAKLEQAAVLLPKPRSGIVVRDARRYGGTSMFPTVLRHAAEHADDAVTFLRDGLSARRALALEVVSALLKVPQRQYSKDLTAAIDAFAECAKHPAGDLRSLAEAENEIIRTMLIAANRPAVLAIYNDITAMLFASDAVLEAIYKDPMLHVNAWRMFEALMLSSTREHDLAFIGPLLEARDESVARAYARALSSGGVKSPVKRAKKTAEHERKMKRRK